MFSTPRPRTLLAATALASLTVVGLPLAGGTALASGSSSLTIQAPSAITYSHSATLTGRLVHAGTTTGVAGRTVVVQSRPQGATTWRSVASVRTAAKGAFHLAVRPASNREYRAFFAAGSGLGRSVSATRSVGVHALVGVSLDQSTLPSKAVFHLQVTVSPARPGGTVVWEQLTANGWSVGGTATLDGASSASIGLISSRAGTIQLRAVATATGAQLAGASGAVTVTITPSADPTTPPPPSFPGGPPPAPGSSAR